MIQVQVKLRLRPAQERLLERWLWRLTSVFNWASRKIELDAAVGVYHRKYDLCRLLVGHGPKMGVPTDAIEGTVWTAYDAWDRCFNRVSRRPRLKGRRNRLNGIPFPHGREMRLAGTTLNIPKLGRVRFHERDIPPGRVTYARLVRRASGWHACLFIDAEPRSIVPVGYGQVGIDPGFASLATLSTGEVVGRPNEHVRHSARLAQAQRGGSRRLAARLQERISSARRDRNHKLSRRLVAENETICWSKDRVSSIARLFGKSVSAASHSELARMLAYKSHFGGRRFIEVPSRNSTRTCSSCLGRTGPTGFAGLKVRSWQCSACGATHDRDCNSAVNTLRTGLGISLERTGDGPTRNRHRRKPAKFTPVPGATTTQENPS